jgi:hypothetical protein
MIVAGSSWPSSLDAPRGAGEKARCSRATTTRPHAPETQEEGGGRARPVAIPGIFAAVVADAGSLRRREAGLTNTATQLLPTPSCSAAY